MAFLKTADGGWVNERYIIRLWQNVKGGWLAEISGLRYDDGSGPRSFNVAKRDAEKFMGMWE